MLLRIVSRSCGLGALLLSGLAHAEAPPAEGSAKKDGWVDKLLLEQPGKALGAASYGAGAYGAAFEVRGSDRDVTGGGGGVGAHLLGEGGIGAFTMRLANSVRLGGSSAGLDVQLAADLGFGVRAPTRYVSPFARLGFAANVNRVDRFTVATIQLPEVDAGVQAGTRGVYAAASGLAGATLGGVLRMGQDGERTIGTAPHLGARLTLGVYKVVGTATWRRIFEQQNEPKTPIDHLDAALCVSLARRSGVLVCVDGRAIAGAIGYPGLGFRDSSAWYGGLSINYGGVL